MSEEKRYTLEEAKKILTEAECSRDGHYLRFIYIFSSSDPVRAYCEHCSRQYDMTPLENNDE